MNGADTAYYSLFLILIFGTLFLLYTLYVVTHWLRRRRLLKRLETMPLPEDYRSALRRIGHYRMLGAAERERLERAVLLFAHTVPFMGVRLTVNDEMRAVVAFYACFMVLQKPQLHYGALKAIYLYDDDFVVDELHERGGIASRAKSILEGQASPDAVVLSWPQARDEAYGQSENNVIVHEFAHLLDFEAGYVDGTPPLEDEQLDAWDAVMETEYDNLCAALEHEDAGKYELIGDYASSDEGEFFAVCSERFFQCPDLLKRDFTELYEQLRLFYNRDMAANV